MAQKMRESCSKRYARLMQEDRCDSNIYLTLQLGKVFSLPLLLFSYLVFSRIRNILGSVET